MADSNQNKARFEEIARRGLQDQLRPDLRARFDAAVERGIISLAKQEETIQEQLVGAGEFVLSMATGAGAQVVGGLAGLAEGVATFVEGGDASQAAAERVEEITERFTFQPKTEAGQRVQETVGKVFEPLMAAATAAGESVIDPNVALGKGVGSPLLAAGVQTGIEMLPSLFGARSPGTITRRQRSAQTEAALQAATDIGVDPSARIPVQRQQVIESAEAQTGGQIERAERFGGIQKAVQQARTVEKGRVNKLYDEARATEGAIQQAPIGDYIVSAREALKTFDIEDMPTIRNRMADLEELATRPNNPVITLNELALFRQRINTNRPSRNANPQEFAANGILKGQLDSFLNAQFNSDMITGNPAAVTKWRTANEAFKEFKNTFDADKTIRQFADEEVNPIEARNWIFGMGSLGGKSESANLVTRLKNIVGEDSPSMTALRQEALFDIMEPLLREEPNLIAFTQKYDRLVRNNKQLADALFPESITDLDKLRSFAGAAEVARGPGIKLDVPASISKALWGNALAQGAMKVSFGAQALKLMQRAVSKSDKRRVMESVLGYDPNITLLPATPAAIGGMVQTLEQENGR